MEKGYNLRLEFAMRYLEMDEGFDRREGEGGGMAHTGL